MIDKEIIMIFGNINNLKEYSFLEAKVKKCFEYAKEHDLLQYEKGSHEIDGDNLFVNIVSYTTTTPEERFWEAHKKYLDVHLMLDGTEQIDLNFIQNMQCRISNQSSAAIVNINLHSVSPLHLSHSYLILLYLLRVIQ